MSQIFNTKRFFLLLRNILHTRLKYVLLLPVLIIVVQFFSFLENIYGRLLRGGAEFRYYKIDFEEYFQSGFLIGIALIAFLFSKVFQAGNMNRSKIVMIPASNFEKWLAVTTATLVPFTVLFLLLSIVFESVRYDMVHNYIANFEVEPEILFNSFSVYKYRVLHSILIYWSMALFILIAGTYFRKMPILFTLASIILIVFVGHYLNHGFAHLVVPDAFAVDSARPFKKIVLKSMENQYFDYAPVNRTVYGMQHLKPWVYFGAYPILIVGLMFLFYHRIKETQA